MERGRPERPLDDASGPVRDLAASLRTLRAAAGNPSYRTMAATAHFSAATLARAAAGHRLPSREVVVAYATACGADREEWEQRWRACTEEVARARAESPAVNGQPDDAEDMLLLGQLPPRDRGPTWRRRRTRRRAAALAAVALVVAATGVVVGISATSGAPRQAAAGATASAPALDTAPAPANAVTSDPRGPYTQPLGRACNPNANIADISGAPAQEPGHGSVRMSFEAADDIHRWAPWWPEYAGIVRNLTTTRAIDGKQSLQVRVTGPFVAIGTNRIAGLTPGARVTVHIWYTGQGSGYICPYSEDMSGTDYWIPQQPLVLNPSLPAGWYTYSWPTASNFLPKGTGFQLSKTSKTDFVILLDAITW